MTISIKQDNLKVEVALEEDDFEESVQVRSFCSLLKRQSVMFFQELFDSLFLDKRGYYRNPNNDTIYEDASKRTISNPFSDTEPL